MNCRRVSNLMSAYVDGELTGVEMLEIRRHLTNCEECTEEREAVLFAKHAVSRLRTVTPREGFVNSLMSNLEIVEVPPYQRMFNTAARFFHRKLSPVAAALAASGLALVVLTAGGIDGVPQPDTDYAMTTPFESSVKVSFLPEVHDNPTAIATIKPLKVAGDGTYFKEASFEFAGLVAAK